MKEIKRKKSLEMWDKKGRRTAQDLIIKNRIGVSKYRATKMNLTKQLEADLAAMIAERDALKAVVIDDHYDAQKMRIWGGMEWAYHSIYAKRIHDRTRAAIDSVMQEKPSGRDEPLPEIVDYENRIAELEAQNATLRAAQKSCEELAVAAESHYLGGLSEGTGKGVILKSALDKWNKMKGSV